MKIRLPLTLFALSVLPLVLLLALPSAQAADLSLGRDLVNQNCFNGCHETQFNSAPPSKVQSLAGLREQIKMCSHALGWQDAQVDAATAYINEQFYHLQ
jgi:hypothetical protein